MTPVLPRTLGRLMARMSLEEKVAQLQAVPIAQLLDEGKKFSPEKAAAHLKHGIGQICRIAGDTDLPPRRVAALANEIQAWLQANTRLGIPAMMHDECLSGFTACGATTFPQAIGLASTWDPDLIQAMTGVIRRQMRSVGTHQALAPVLDVLRDPRWGRCEETLGEDPYLVAVLATAYIRGLQGERLKTGIAATAKHFAGHAFSEGGRNCGPAPIGPRELADRILFPFEAAVREARVKSVMNAYHDIDGIPCAASRELLTGLLRDQWGFDGIVVSDYDAIDRLRKHHYTAADKAEAARQALEAGLDLELPAADCYGEPLITMLKQGRVARAPLDTSVRRILRLKMELGLFARTRVKINGVEKQFDTPGDRRLARTLGQRSLVLLKNDGALLPLNKNIKNLAVIGPMADSIWSLMGDYSHMVLNRIHAGSEAFEHIRVVSILEGIRRRLSPETVVCHAKGCDLFGAGMEGFDEAIRMAKAAEVAVVAVGDQAGMFRAGTTGENIDRDDISLYGVQEKLVRAIVQTGTPVVLILVNGRPPAIAELARSVPAILEAWFPGEEGGNAVADVLCGDVNPGGKLPVSLIASAGQVPLTYNLKPIPDGVGYLDKKVEPVFPFGHGLSYTQFTYANLVIAPARIKADGVISIRGELANTGGRTGDEVVQLYLRDEVAGVVRPAKELKGFKRITLKPDQRRRICFVLAADQLAFHGRDLRRVIEPGFFQVMLGSSSADIRLKGRFEVTGKARLVRRPTFFSRVLITKCPANKIA